MNAKIGVLIPHSKTYPTMGKDYINGLKLGAKDSSITYSFIVEGIGLGADQKVIIDKAQKLTNQDDVHVITGLLGHIGIDELEEYAKSLEVVLLYSDLGATIPKETKENSWVFCNSFELYKSASLFGLHAANWGHKNIAISTSYYDAGYGLASALGKTLYKSGGEFAGHFITPLHPRENEPELMKDFIQETKPDAIYAIHSGVYAKEHAEFLSKNNISKETPFYSTAFGIDANLISENEVLFENAKCISSWFLEEERDANKKFIKQYLNEYGKAPSAFTLLGYENGLILKEAIGQLKDDNLKSHQLKDVLTKIEVEGPRGNLSFNDKSNRTSFPHYLWKNVKHNGSYKKHKEETLDFSIKVTKSVLNETSNQTGGWNNAYLCD